MDVDKEIMKIQAGTRTLFRVFNPLHNWLLAKNKFYYAWSVRPFSRAIHWVVLLAYLISFPLAFLNSNGKFDKTEAAGTTFTEDFSTTTHEDSVNTTAIWDTTHRSARIPYIREPYIDLTIVGDSFSGNTVNTGAAYVTSSASANNHVTYIFGGQRGSAPNTNIYRYDSNAAVGNRLTSISATLDKSPDGRTSAVYVPNLDKIYIISGSNEDGTEHIWAFDVATESISHLPVNIDNTFNSGLAYHPSDQKLYIVGGTNMYEFCGVDFCPTDDIYTLSLPDYGLAKVFGEGDAPPSTLSNSSSAVFFGTDALSDTLFVVGGYNQNNADWRVEPGCEDDCMGQENLFFPSYETKNLIYSLDINNQQTSTYLNKMTDQNGAANSAFAQNGNDVYFYGGQSGIFNYDSPSVINSDKISHLNLTNLVTSGIGMETTNQPTMPSAISGQSAIYNPDQNRFYVFGVGTSIYQHNGAASFINQSSGINNNLDGREITAYGQTETEGFILGGDAGNRILKYDLASGASSNVGEPLTVIPRGRGVYANNKIYFFGGEGEQVRDIYEFNPSDNSLVTKGSLSSDCVSSSCSAVYNGTDTVIIASGADIQKYTPGAASPSAVLATLNGNVFTDGFWFGERAYFVTNSSNPSCNIYNPTDNSIVQTTCPTFYNYDNKFNPKGFSFQTTTGSYYLESYYNPGSASTFRFEFTSTSITASNIYMTIPTKVDRTSSALALFHDANNSLYFLMNDGNTIKMNYNFDTSKNTVVSNKLNTNNSPIGQATLTATDTKPTSTTISYQMTADGSNWEDVVPGQPHSFSHVGSDLRWKAVLNGTVSVMPTVNGVTISYLGQPATLFFSDRIDTTHHATYDNLVGIVGPKMKIGLKDSAGTGTIAVEDIHISIQNSSPSVKFSDSPNGPWAESLDLTIVQGQESVYFYIVILDAGVNVAVGIHSEGFSDISFRARSSGQAMFTNTFAYEPTPPTAVVGSPITLIADSAKNTAYSIGGYTGSFTSSSDKDTFSEKISVQNENNTVLHTSAVMTSTSAGERTISLLLTNNTASFIAQSPTKVTFLPDVAIKATLSSNRTDATKAGEEFVVTASLFDKFDNLATNSNHSLELISTDPTFAKQTYQLAPSDGGKHDFKVTLKTAGPQTFYLKDTTANTTAFVPIIVLHDDALSSTSKFTTDKGKLVLEKDKATLTLKVADQYGNGVPNVPVFIKNDQRFGTLDKHEGTTGSSGTATFTYTPTKEGKETLSAYTDTFEINDKVVLENVPNTLLNQLSSVIDDLKNNAAAKAIANVANIVVATTAILGLIPLIASILSSAPAALHAVTYAFSLSMEAIGGRKRRRSWGRVYDSATGKGIDLALVRLYDQDTMKLKGTIVTDLHGRFSFQPLPGSYIISVIKDKYVFPTQIFAKYGISRIDKSASRINSHYVGQPINVTDENNLINLDIPIDPLHKKPTTLVMIKTFLNDFIEIITSGLSYIFIPSILVGSAVSIFAAVILPTTRNITICLTYILVALVYVITHLVKIGKFSVVYDERDKKPIPQAVVSVFDEKHNTLKETRITDKFGRFSINIPPGNYKLKVEREGFGFPSKNTKKNRFQKDERYSNLYFGDVIVAKKEKFINVSVPMDEKYGELTIK